MSSLVFPCIDSTIDSVEGLVFTNLAIFVLQVWGRGAGGGIVTDIMLLLAIAKGQVVPLWSLIQSLTHLINGSIHSLGYRDIVLLTCIDTLFDYY